MDSRRGVWAVALFDFQVRQCSLCYEWRGWLNCPYDGLTCSACLTRWDLGYQILALKLMHRRCHIFQNDLILREIAEFVFGDGFLASCICGVCEYSWMKRGWKCRGMKRPFLAE